MSCFTSKKKVLGSTTRQGIIAELKAGKHVFFSDETPEFGGEDKYPDPWDYIMAGLISCTLISIKEKAKEESMPLLDAKVEVHYRWDDDKGHLFCKKIHLEGDLSPEQRESLEKAAHSPAHKMLEQGLNIRTEKSL